MTLTNIGLVEFAKSKLGTPYVYGMKGTVLTDVNFQNLQGKHGKDKVWNSDKKKIGLVCVDCSGLISWFTKKVKGSSQFRAESVPHPISTIKNAPAGAAVWRDGHIGIYIGGGEVIEARGSAYGVVKTQVKNRDFTHWFLLNDIMYEEEAVLEKLKMIIHGKEVKIDGFFTEGKNYPDLRELCNVIGGLNVSNKGKVPVIEKE